MKLFKKILCGIISATLLLTITAMPTMAKNDVSVVLDGEKLSFDVPPQIINDRTMVPLRAIFEALGASVKWNQSTQTVTSKKGSVTIELTINSKIMYVNNTRVTLDSPACIIDDRTLVPMRAISEAYGIEVEWNSHTRTVAMYSQKVEKEQPTPMPKPKTTPKPQYVSLNEIRNISGNSFYEVDRKQLNDSYGNTYSNALYGFENYTFQALLNEKYSKFTCTLYTPEEWSVSDDTTRIIIKADEQTIYTSPVLDKTSKPVKVDVDISGCNNFELTVETDGWHEIGLIGDGKFYTAN